MTDAPPIRLAPPGAGVSRTQVLLGVTALRLLALRSIPTLLARLEIVSGELMRLCPADETAATKRVLVPPVLGIEDSSRYWSCAMVLEHLTIVGRVTEHLVAQLAAGRRVPRRVRTADVKPSGGISRAESVAAFEAMVRSFVTAVRARPEAAKASTRHSHPWFGLLRCKQWIALMPLHHGVHLRQMRAIRKRLPAENW